MAPWPVCTVLICVGSLFLKSIFHNKGAKMPLYKNLQIFFLLYHGAKSTNFRATGFSSSPHIENRVYLKEIVEKFKGETTLKCVSHVNFNIYSLFWFLTKNSNIADMVSTIKFCILKVQSLLEAEIFPLWIFLVRVKTPCKNQSISDWLSYRPSEIYLYCRIPDFNRLLDHCS